MPSLASPVTRCSLLNRCQVAGTPDFISLRTLVAHNSYYCAWLQSLPKVVFYLSAFRATLLTHVAAKNRPPLFPTLGSSYSVLSPYTPQEPVGYRSVPLGRASVELTSANDTNIKNPPDLAFQCLVPRRVRILSFRPFSIHTSTSGQKRLR